MGEVGTGLYSGGAAHNFVAPQMLLHFALLTPCLL